MSDLPASELQPDDESARLIAEKTAGNAGLAPASWTRQLLEIRGWPETEETN
jgi:hypothetical protein